jgi:hypothetical protein
MAEAEGRLQAAGSDVELALAKVLDARRGEHATPEELDVQLAGEVDARSVEAEL